MCLKRIVSSCLVLPMTASVAFAQQAPPGDPIVQKALAIHERAITLDTHVDIFTTYATPALDPGTTTTLQCDLTKMETGGLDGVFLAVFVGQGPLDESGYGRAYDQAMVKFDALKRLTERMYPNRTELARRGYTEAQIGKIWGENLLRVWRDVERTAAGLER